MIIKRKQFKDLIAKKGENSLSNFLADFLFSSLNYATYIKISETVLSLALGLKLGPQEDDFTSRPEKRGNDPLEKIFLGSMGLRY